jgi:pyridinium-3,5-bisthiocarboxylic acid mononucleotide nickel chelatase
VFWGECGGYGEGMALPVPLTHVTPPAEPVVLLETNIDDQPAEQLAYVCERLLALGALDAWLAPIQMKKGRPGVLLAALVPAGLEDAAVALIIRETTTLGVRRRPVQRHVAARDLVTVETIYGPVRVKAKRWNGEAAGVAPEYEDCAQIAREYSLPLRDVYALAVQAFDKR